MAAKKKTKKKKTTRKSRSKAAHKGWVTRRLNRQEAVLLHAIRKGDKSELSKLLGIDIPDWLRKMPPDLARQYAEFAEKVREEKWVAAQDPEYTYNGKRGKPGRKYERGAIALMPSRARHLGRATDEALKMMRKAYKEGGNTENSAVFKNTMQRISQALDLPIKEIYTLWFS
jgi:hypothetical protein